MMYLGNKTRLSKYLIPIVSKNLNGRNMYIEPFAGALGVISNLKYENRIAIDIDPYIISLMKSIKNGWNPPTEISEDLYIDIKNNLNKYSKELIGFVGYGCSFGGKWFAGRARGGKTAKGEPRNHVAESARNLVKMRPQLQGMIFICSSYHLIETDGGQVVYCDPPYKNTTKYKDTFNHNSFWEWVRKQSYNNDIYISEYTAPSDFKSVWEKEHKSGIGNNMITHKKSIEKLFVHESKYD